MIAAPTTFRELPRAPHTGWLLCDPYVPSGQPVPFATRDLCRHLGVAHLPDTLARLRWACQTMHVRYCVLVLPTLGRLPNLSNREAEVLVWVARGKSNASIAATLVLSERAIEKHTNSIFSKLGLSEERDLNRRVSAVLVYLHNR